MVSDVVYRLFDLVEPSTEHMEGGDESLQQATRNGASLPASGVYRPTVYWPALYRLGRSALIEVHYSELRPIGLPAEGLPVQSRGSNRVSMVTFHPIYRPMMYQLRIY